MASFDLEIGKNEFNMNFSSLITSQIIIFPKSLERDSFPFSSHSVLSGPFLGHGLVLGLVSLEESRDVRHKRVVWVGVCQERTD